MAVAVAVTVTMRMPGLGIGTGFRIKRGGVVHHSGAQAFRQFFQHVVRGDAHVGALVVHADGQGHVAVAQVVTQARQGLAVFDSGGDHLFLGRADANDLSGFCQ